MKEELRIQNEEGRKRRLARAPGDPLAGAMRDAPPKPAEPRPGLYRHYKDNPYRVIGLALHSETREWLVVYEALYGEGGLFVRPAAMFVETVEVAGRRVPRFARVGD
jgi:hypothetical protein